MERSQNSLYDFFTLKLAIFKVRCDKFSEVMCKKIINALCGARFKARQFVIKITNHKKSFGNGPICTTPPRGCTNVTGLNLSVKKS